MSVYEPPPHRPHLDVMHFSFPHGTGVYESMRANWTAGKRERRVEVTVSPTGRSLHVHVDGVEWGPLPVTEGEAEHG